MALRVSEEEVEEIITTSLNIDPFIKTANQIITNHLTGKGLSSDTLILVELWLSAHLVACADPQLKEETIGDAKETKNVGPLGKGLEASVYGQQVKLLDTTGTLAAMGKKLAGFDVIASDSDEYS